LTAPSQPNPRAANTPQTFHVPLQGAIAKLIDSATTGDPCGDNDTCADPNFECRVKPGLDPGSPKNKVCVDVGHLVPLARSDKPTIQPAFGRPKPLQPAGTTAPTSPPGKEPGPNEGTSVPKTDTGGEGGGGGPLKADKAHPETPPPTENRPATPIQPANPDKKPPPTDKKPTDKKPEGQPKK
jgi:hypothetical protein